MCGIWGFVGRETTVDVADAWTGLESLTARGPDDWGVWTPADGKVTTETSLPSGPTTAVLGNRRLSIIDLSPAGNQPMVHSGPDGDTVLVYNGELYNYLELRERLTRRGYGFESDSDTEVVLAAYREYGVDAVEHFRGMFAFAVLDEQSARLVLGRDRFGIKPLFALEHGDGIAFASQLRALLASGLSEGHLDRRGLAGYLTFGFVPSPYTIVDDIEVLPPATTRTYNLETGGTEQKRYWRPPFDETEPVTTSAVRDALVESLKYRMRSDVPVGAFLSGGLDSSTMVGLLQQSVREPDADPIRTFSVGFDVNSYSELDDARAVADAFGTDHEERTVTGETLRDSLSDIIDAMDQPMTDGLNTYLVSELAHQSGMKVVFSGAGADELLYGYHTFELAPKLIGLSGASARLPAAVRSAAGSTLETAGVRVPKRYRPRNPRKVADIVRSGTAIGSTYTALRGLYSSSMRTRLQEDGGVDAGMDDAVEESIGEYGRLDTRDAVSAVELSKFLHDDILYSTDMMSMAHSLEVRLPFLDSRLASLLARAPPDQKAGSPEKPLLRSVAMGLVPDRVLAKDKSGFVFPLDHWLEGPLHPVAREALSERYIRQIPLDASAVQQVWDEYFDGVETHTSQLWSLVVLSLWVDAHLA